MRRYALSIAGAVVVALLALAALFAPLVAPRDPLAMNPRARLTGPSAAHLLVENWAAYRPTHHDVQQFAGLGELRAAAGVGE